MAAVALIGPDGAGKTTLTRMLEGSGLRPFKYIYMGVDIGASNIALPTSRLAEMLKTRLGRNPVGPPRGYVPARASRRGALGTVRAAIRLANRLADESYRQCVSWLYQARGITVLYDRHFAFDFALEVAGDAKEAFDRRVHRLWLERVYPKPDMVIFLDVPGQVLYARKGELTIAELERRRLAFLRVGTGMPGFVTVDATRPLQDVYSEIAALIEGLGKPTIPGTSNAPTTVGASS